MQNRLQHTVLLLLLLWQTPLLTTPGPRNLPAGMQGLGKLTFGAPTGHYPVTNGLSARVRQECRHGVSETQGCRGHLLLPPLSSPGPDGCYWWKWFTGVHSLCDDVWTGPPLLR